MRISYRCEHLYGVPLSKTPHPHIALVQFGAKAKILICKICFEKLKRGERTISLTNKPNRERYLSICPGQEDELFPELLVDVV